MNIHMTCGQLATVLSLRCTTHHHQMEVGNTGCQTEQLLVQDLLIQLPMTQVTFRVFIELMTKWPIDLMTEFMETNGGFLMAPQALLRCLISTLMVHPTLIVSSSMEMYFDSAPMMVFMETNGG